MEGDRGIDRLARGGRWATARSVRRRRIRTAERRLLRTPDPQPRFVREPARVRRSDLLPQRPRRAPNREGRRFCDETIGDHISPLALVEQPEARALLIYDQYVHDEWMMKAYVKGTEPLDRFQLAYRRGAPCAIADKLDGFGDLPQDWGIPARRCSRACGGSTTNARPAAQSRRVAKTHGPRPSPPST